MDNPSLAGWSPATFREGQRLNANVVEIAALCMDVDEGAVPLKGIVAALAPYRAFVHSTRRFTPAAPRWRLVVATSRSMGPDEHAPFATIWPNVE